MIKVTKLSNISHEYKYLYFHFPFAIIHETGHKCFLSSCIDWNIRAADSVADLGL